ncbi:hypothetical protein HUU05_15050 [candidate division KSB1 bacterium]|nr:hypothetical protein [candidate division KSB1 bacterium]
MDQQITLTLSEAALQRASNLAGVVSRPIEKILADALEYALPDIGSEVLPAVATLSNDEVVALAQARMNAKEDAQLSELLERQQAGALTNGDRATLNNLFQAYLRLWLRQSEALAEAVKRGLRESLSSVA